MCTNYQRLERFESTANLERVQPWTAGTSTSGPGAGLSEKPGGGVTGAGLSETLGCGPANGPKAAHISCQYCILGTSEGIFGHIKGHIEWVIWGQQHCRN